MKKYLVILLINVLLVTSVAWAKERKKDCRRDGKDRTKIFLKLQEALKLTDQQMKQIYEKIFTFKKERIKDRATLALALLELKEIRAQDESDMKKIEAKIREIANLKANMQIKKLKEIENIKSVLTESQKETLKNLKKHPNMLKSLTGEDVIEQDLPGSIHDDITESPDVVINSDGKETSLIEEVFSLNLIQD